jgi:hypothetical protein
MDIVLGAIAASGAQSLAPVQGRVVDEDGKPVANATVSLNDHPAELRTDASGAFVISDAPTGSHMVRAAKIGHTLDWRALDIPASGLSSVELVIERGDVKSRVNRVRRVVNERDRRELAIRRATDVGHTVDAKSLAKLESAARAAAMFGFKSLPSGTVLGKKGCKAAVYVDGLLDLNGSGGVFQSLTGKEIELIEAFIDGREAPTRYRLGDCGVVLAWTKSGLEGR